MDASIFIFTLLLVCAVVILLWVLMLRYRYRELRHKERMAAIERNVALPDLDYSSNGRAPRTYLLRGMVWLFGGIALSIFLFAVSVTTRAPESGFLTAQPQQPPPGTGVSAQSLQNYGDGDFYYVFPLGFSMLGLVPAAVGIAYLIFYRSETSGKQ